MSLRLFVSSAAIICLSAVSTYGEKAETFEQAKTLSAQSGKPILLEFNHDDCIHCQQATRELDSIPELKAELEKVILLRLSVLQGEGTKLSKDFLIGMSFPVFIVADSAGNVFTRWTGYTGSEQFLSFLGKGMSERVTIDQRVARCQDRPTSADINFLADYFTETRQFTKALEYSRQLQSLEPGLNLAYRAFKAAAEAVWSDELPFDSVINAANQMLADTLGNRYYFGEMAQTLANVARKVGRTDILEKYLMAGIEQTAERKDKSGIDLHRNLLADYALHVLQDTTEAVSVKTRALGTSWDQDPGRAFQFADWCFRRNLRLLEAEQYVRFALQKAPDDNTRATRLRLLAQICYARGNNEEAIRRANEALALDPSAIWFEKKLDEWRSTK
jgi:tetratricopeptide (TPR) repeat protein